MGRSREGRFGRRERPSRDVRERPNYRGSLTTVVLLRAHAQEKGRLCKTCRARSSAARSSETSARANASVGFPRRSPADTIARMRFPSFACLLVVGILACQAQVAGEQERADSAPRRLLIVGG